MEENKEILSNMVTAAIDQKPIDFQDSFNSIFMDKLQSAINIKKVQYAQQIYGKKAVEDINLETEFEEE